MENWYRNGERGISLDTVLKYYNMIDSDSPEYGEAYLRIAHLHLEKEATEPLDNKDMKQKILILSNALKVFPDPVAVALINNCIHDLTGTMDFHISNDDDRDTQIARLITRLSQKISAQHELSERPHNLGRKGV